MNLYHTLSRGVDKRKIFMDDQDRYRFIHDLFEFNDQESTNNYLFHLERYNKLMGLRNPLIINQNKAKQREQRRVRKILVDIHAFCLMDNHYHLLITPKIENGLPLFMKKLNAGYANYFNLKYERDGALFEGRYKKIIIKDHAHFVHIPYYIHLNPLDFQFPEWRDRNLTSSSKAIKYLESYRWSSHLDYLGKQNFSSVINKKLLLSLFDDEDGYKKSIYSWLNELAKFWQNNTTKPYLLE